MKPLTLLQACKKIIYAIDPVDFGWPEGTTPYQVYMKEYGDFFGFHPHPVSDYCQGLPSLFDFPFENLEILETLKSYGIVRHSNTAITKLIEDYWLNIGYAAFRILKESKKNETVL